MCAAYKKSQTELQRQKVIIGERDIWFNEAHFAAVGRSDSFIPFNNVLRLSIGIIYYLVVGNYVHNFTFYLVPTGDLRAEITSNIFLTGMRTDKK